VEILPITNRMTSRTVPPRAIFLDALDNILTSLGIDRVVLMSNSYGTLLSAYIIHSACPQSAQLIEAEGHHGRHFHPIIHKISHTILIDPIPILLHLPSVAYNFLYRMPSRAAEWQLWYMASRDPDIARALGRSFFWEQGALWGDDLAQFMETKGERQDLNGTVRGPRSPACSCRRAGRNMTVVLSAEDQIVPVEEVRHYLTGQDEPSLRWVGNGPNWPWSSKLSDGLEMTGDGTSTLEVLFYPGLDHGTVFDTKERRRGILDATQRYINVHGNRR